MSGPTFDQIGTDQSAPESKSSSTTSRNSGDNQLFIKGRWGTEVHRSGDGCDRCSRNASCVVVARMNDDKGEIRASVNACDEHKDQIVRELENQYDAMIVVREY